MKRPPQVELWFAELYKTEHDRVFQVAYALAGDAAIAEDATQEAFVRALERWDRLRDQPWAAGWVTTTAVNLARRMLRRRRWTFRPGSSVIEPAADGALDVWQAVKPAALGIPAWPAVPRGQDWKEGVCRALGWPDPREGWRRVLAAVDSYADLEVPLLRAVEELVDFVTG